ncbi:Nudix hydrolase 8 [Linum perenne]
MELMKPPKSLASSSFSIFSSISHSNPGRRLRFSVLDCCKGTHTVKSQINFLGFFFLCSNFCSSVLILAGMVAKASCNLLPTSSISSAAGSEEMVTTHSYFFGSSLLKKTTANVLEACDDEYGGIIVDPHRLPHNPNDFASLLRSSLSHWRIKGKKGIWLKLPLERSQLVPIAVEEGFEYHHAEPGYVMLTYWIPELQPCMLPSNASHHVGVGGFVVNENNEVYI